MKLFKGKFNNNHSFVTAQTATRRKDRYSIFDDYNQSNEYEYKLFDSIRGSVPIIDAAILKIIRLVGKYDVTCNNIKANKILQDFIFNVKVGAVSCGLESFICSYLNSLLMYGNAIGEVVLDTEMSKVIGLYNANLENITFKKGSTPFDLKIYVKENNDKLRLIKDNRFIFSTALNPKPDSIIGESLLKGLPFVTSILMTILNSVGQNFERIGNLRYAVNYKPSDSSIDKAYAKERAMQIAKEWSDGMSASKSGNITDFISVGDVDIKVIGADNQMLDTQVPVRQILEQIIAKLGIPPFLLGISWSTTERMSKQQADILTSELEYYRRLLSPMIVNICNTFLHLSGYDEDIELKWGIINLQDEIEISRSKLYLAQAQKINGEMNDDSSIV